MANGMCRSVLTQSLKPSKGVYSSMYVPEGLALAYEQYRNEPKRMYDLLNEVVRQQPDIFRIPIVRNHWLQFAILERRMRLDRLEQGRGMDAQSVQAAIPNTQVLLASLSPLQNRI